MGWDVLIYGWLVHILVGGLKHEFYFSIGNAIIPTDDLHHFSEG
jgi:NhaP-type Na+/H+ or K+/H+ antiporter